MSGNLRWLLGKKILIEDIGLLHPSSSEQKSNENKLFSIIGNKRQSDRALYEAWCWGSVWGNMMHGFLYEQRKVTGQVLFSENTEIRWECKDFLCKRTQGSNGAGCALSKRINSSSQVNKVKHNKLSGRDESAASHLWLSVKTCLLSHPRTRTMGLTDLVLWQTDGA